MRGLVICFVMQMSNIYTSLFSPFVFSLGLRQVIFVYTWEYLLYVLQTMVYVFFSGLFV